MKRNTVIAGLVTLTCIYCIFWVVIPRTLTDFYAPWCGVREIIARRNPYKKSVTDEIQTYYYGQPLASTGRRDQQRFAYPVTVTLLLFPAAVDWYFLAQHIVIAMQIIAVYCYTKLSVKIIHTAHGDFHFPDWAITLLVLTSPPILQGMRMQQVGLLVPVFVLWAISLATKNKHYMSGVVIALAFAFKPQLAFLPGIWLLAYGLRKGWQMIEGFIITGLVLFCVSTLWLRQLWVVDWLRGLITYRHYSGASFVDALFGNFIGDTLTILSLIWLTVFIRRNWAKFEEEFVRGACVVLAVSVFVIPGLLMMYNYILFVPGILWISFVRGKEIQYANRVQ